MDDKGQISVEYLLLIVVILTILSTVTIPLVGQSIDAANDVSWTSDTKIAVESTANAVNIVHANGPGARRTFNVHIPQNNMTLRTSGREIFIVTMLSNGTSKNVSSATSHNLTTTSLNLTKGWRTLQVEWPIGQNRISISRVN